MVTVAKMVKSMHETPTLPRWLRPLVPVTLAAAFFCLFVWYVKRPAAESREAEPAKPIIVPGRIGARPVVPAASRPAPASVRDVLPVLSEGVVTFTRVLSMPVLGIKPEALHSNFDEGRSGRGGHRHEAIDILAPRGTPVMAADEGVVRKIFKSVPGGLTIYQFDPTSEYCYYYAHLEAYAAGLHEGQVLKRGDVIGFVGTTGNAPETTPHLHFAVYRLEGDKSWWRGQAIDPYPLLVKS